MPMVTVPSGSARIHSWLSTYLRSEGTFITGLPGDGLGLSLDEDPAVADERRLHDARGETPVADLDVHGVAGRHARGQARERDRLSQRGRERAAGDLAFAGIGV